MIIEPPTLATLFIRASWLNRAGRIDRSACVEVSAAELRHLVVWNDPRFNHSAPQHADEADREHEGRDSMWQRLHHATTPRSPTQTRSWIHPRSQSQTQRATDGQGSAQQTAAVNGRVTSRGFTKDVCGHVYVGRGDLMTLHRQRMPRTLRGDWRTGKSNAIRPTDDSSEGRLRAEKLRRRQRASWNPQSSSGGGSSARAFDEADGLPGNPNKGATITKVLVLPKDWGQVIDVRLRRMNAILSRHYLVCPICRRCVVKLFMPLATRSEMRDAQIARLWLRGLCDPSRGRPNAPGSEAERAVVERYGALLEPESRQLRCGRCLGLRYGESRRRHR